MKYDIQDTVNRINALRASGETWADTVKQLNKEGYRTTTAASFTVSTAIAYLRRQLAALKRQQPQPQAPAAPASPVVDLRGAVLATLDFKIPADKRIELLRTILT